MEFHHYPIAHRRPLRSLVRSKPQLSAGFRPAFAEVSRDAPEFPLLPDNPRRHRNLPFPATPKSLKVRIPSPQSNRHGIILPRPWPNTRPPLASKGKHHSFYCRSNHLGRMTAQGSDANRERAFAKRLARTCWNGTSGLELREGMPRSVPASRGDTPTRENFASRSHRRLRG